MIIKEWVNYCPNHTQRYNNPNMLREIDFPMPTQNYLAPWQSFKKLKEEIDSYLLFGPTIAKGPTLQTVANKRWGPFGAPFESCFRFAMLESINCLHLLRSSLVIKRCSNIRNMFDRNGPNSLQKSIHSCTRCWHLKQDGKIGTMLLWA